MFIYSFPVTRFLLSPSPGLDLLPLANCCIPGSQRGMWVTDKTGCWHSLRFYFLGHLVLSQPELMKPECIVCFVVSGMAVEVRKSL